MYISGEGMATGVAFPRMNQVIILNMGSRFHVSDLYSRDQSINELASTVWLNGKHDAPFMLGNAGEMAMYAIGVKLGMLPWFARLPARETNDQALDAAHWGPASLYSLRQQLLDSPDIQSGFLRIESYLLDILKHKEFHDLARIRWLGKAVYTHSVADITRTLGFTRKKLWQEGLHYFGGSVKQIQGLIRFNETLGTIARQSDQTLSALHPYYDQSHFISDFRYRTGITPLQYRKLCQQFPAIRFTPNFLPMKKSDYLDRIEFKA